MKKNKTKKVKILFVDNGKEYGGGVTSFLYLLENLNRERFQPLVHFVHNYSVPSHLFNFQNGSLNKSKGIESKGQEIGEKKESQLSTTVAFNHQSVITLRQLANKSQQFDNSPTSPSSVVDPLTPTIYKLITLKGGKPIPPPPLPYYFPKLVREFIRLGGRTLLNYLLFRRRLKYAIALLKRVKPDLLHLNNHLNSNLDWIVAANRVGIPVIQHLRKDVPLQKWQIPILKKMDFFGIAVSHSTLNFYRHYLDFPAEVVYNPFPIKVRFGQNRETIEKVLKGKQELEREEGKGAEREKSVKRLDFEEEIGKKKGRVKTDGKGNGDWKREKGKNRTEKREEQKKEDKTDWEKQKRKEKKREWELKQAEKKGKNRDKKGKGEGQVKILFPANYLPQKGHKIVVDAVELALAQLPSSSFFPPFKIYFAGSGNLPPELELKIKNSPVIEELGFVDLERWYRSVDYVLSFSSSEGLPRVVIEGLLYGCGIITGDLPVYREIWELSEKRNYYMLPRRAKSLAQLLLRLKPIGERKPDTQIGRRFGLTQYINSITAIYNRLLQ